MAGPLLVVPDGRSAHAGGSAIRRAEPRACGSCRPGVGLAVVERGSASGGPRRPPRKGRRPAGSRGARWAGLPCDRGRGGYAPAIASARPYGPPVRQPGLRHRSGTAPLPSALPPQARTQAPIEEISSMSPEFRHRNSVARCGAGKSLPAKAAGSRRWDVAGRVRWRVAQGSGVHPLASEGR